MDGYFGELKHFEFLSKQTSFRKGIVLPGKVWDTGMPALMEDLGGSHRFIRSKGAVKAGITTGLGLPVSHIDDQVYIMTFLSAKGTPIARQIEVWVLDADRQGLLFESGYSDGDADLSEQYRDTVINKGEGIIGKVLLSGRPIITEAAEDIYFADNLSAKEASLESLIVIPILVSGRCKSVVALYA